MEARVTTQNMNITVLHSMKTGEIKNFEPFDFRLL
jgi:hypothetical protein